MRDIRPALQFLTLALGDEAHHVARRAVMMSASLLGLATLLWAGL